MSELRFIFYECLFSLGRNRIDMVHISQPLWIMAFGLPSYASSSYAMVSNAPS
jgi:hypothetical protein